MNITDMMESMPISHGSVEPCEILDKDVSFYDDVTGNKIHQKIAIAAKTLEM